VADHRPEYSFTQRVPRERHDSRGRFTFSEIQPFLLRVAQSDSLLFMSLPAINLDFTWVSPNEIEMEIHDDEGMHIGIVTLEQAEETSRRAILAWDASVLQSELSDLPIQWLTSPNV
jgi:hypothetical protein